VAHFSARKPIQRRQSFAATAARQRSRTESKHRTRPIHCGNSPWGWLPHGCLRSFLPIRNPLRAAPDLSMGVTTRKRQPNAPRPSPHSWIICHSFATHWPLVTHPGQAGGRFLFFALFAGREKA
jgi:hypothetical protein